MNYETDVCAECEYWDDDYGCQREGWIDENEPPEECEGMSEWTNVRCIYDLSNGWFPDKDIIAGHMGIMDTISKCKR